VAGRVGLRNRIAEAPLPRTFGTPGNGDGNVECIAIGRPIITAALEEFRVEPKAHMRFHATLAS